MPAPTVRYRTIDDSFLSSQAPTPLFSSQTNLSSAPSRGPVSLCCYPTPETSVIHDCVTDSGSYAWLTPRRTQSPSGNPHAELLGLCVFVANHY